MCFSIKSGLIAGRQHIVYGINCQDSLKSKIFEHGDNTYYVGAVADGCGEGARSELGAQLAVSFLVHRSESLIKDEVSKNNLPGKLLEDLISFLKNVIDSHFAENTPPEVLVSFIKDHLLFTVVGFFITPESSVLYAMGDGVIVLNDLIDIRDENNHPNYVAYHLVDDRYLKEDRTPLPNSFDLYEVPTKNLERLAVGTDAWAEEIGVLLSLWDENVCKNVQRTMNILSKKEKRFKDDAAIITVSKEATNESENR